MTIIQRIILLLGCNGLILAWLQPPVYQVHTDGVRLEHQLDYFWNIAPDWSVNVPLLAARIAIIALVTAGAYLAFRTNAKKESQS